MDYKNYTAGYSKSDFWFRSRLDLINIFLQKNLKNSKETPSKLKILSIGTGTGEELYSLNKFGEVYVVDIEKRALDLIPAKLCKEKKVCDACNLTYPNDFFDLVVAFDVLEHIEKDRLAVSECKRVLKKGGLFLFLVPAFQFLYSAHDKALAHKRRYSKGQLKRLFNEFSGLHLNYWNFILFLPLVIQRLIKRNSEPKVDNPVKNPIIDSVLYKILRFENFLIKNNFKTPPGITIFGICRKD
jgi:ubiquinone/menaquinone biosynthesis C-methylase UbiE